MKDDWDKLTTKWNKPGRKRTEWSVIAEVNCDDDKSSGLCAQYNVESYPSIKFGHPPLLTDYLYQRQYFTLKNWAKTRFRPQCGPGWRMEWCDSASKALVTKFLNMSIDDLDWEIEETKDEAQKHADVFKEKWANVQTELTAKQQEYLKLKETVEEGGLELMEEVLAFRRDASSQ